MPSSYGLVVEGDFDKAIYRKLIEKIRGRPLPIYCRVCSGVGDLKKYFAAFLRDLESAHHENPVDLAFVIRDADGKDPSTLETDLAERVSGQVFAFRYGARFHATRQAVETFLLADVEAINRVAESRAVLRRRVTRPPGPLEDILNPKDYFVDLLSDAGLRYTPKVCEEIAQSADLAFIRRFCPSFERFIEKVS